MQKPLYIKINLPITKNDSKLVLKRYFNRLRNTLIEVQFSNIRDRKIYTYKIEKPEEFKKDFMDGKQLKGNYKLTLVKSDLEKNIENYKKK